MYLRQLLVLAMLLPLPARAGKKAEAAEVEALQRRVVELERQVAELRDQQAERSRAADRSEESALQLAREAATLQSSGDFKGALELYRRVVSQYPNSEVVGLAKRHVEQLAVVGDTLTQLEGEITWLQSEAALDSPVTILVFWEVWCPHCRREVPALAETWRRLRGQGLQVIGLTKLTRGKTEDDVRAFLAEHSIDFPVAKEDGSMSRRLAVSGVPAMAVVKGGEVVWRGHPAQIDDELLLEWLAVD